MPGYPHLPDSSAAPGWFEVKVRVALDKNRSADVKCCRNGNRIALAGENLFPALALGAPKGMRFTHPTSLRYCPVSYATPALLAGHNRRGAGLPLAPGFELRLLQEKIAPLGHAPYGEALPADLARNPEHNGRHNGEVAARRLSSRHLPHPRVR